MGGTGANFRADSVGSTAPCARFHCAHARLGNLRWALAAWLLVLACAATGANAFTIRLGATSFPYEPSGHGNGCYNFEAGETCSTTWALINAPSGIVTRAPGDGTITSWRLRAKESGTGARIRLVVLRPNTDGSYTSTAISEPASDVAGNPNPTSLPIKAGSYIAATTSTEGASGTEADILGPEEPKYATLFSSFDQLEQTLMPYNSEGYYATRIGADVVLAPGATSLSPASGPASGGTVVTIKGKYLGDATQVLFGSSPATQVGSNEIETLQATAPPGTAGSTVDVRVIGPGGTSASSAAMRFTYADAVTLTGGVALTGGVKNVPGPAFGPALAGLSESNSTFVVGPTSTALSGATASRQRRGTVFSFTLDQAATVKVDIRRLDAGRRAGHSCRAFKRSLAHKPGCTRSITVATLARTGHAGLNKLPFSGRISGRALRAGSYQARFSARGATGVSATRTVAFTIVRG